MRTRSIAALTAIIAAAACTTDSAKTADTTAAVTADTTMPAAPAATAVDSTAPAASATSSASGMMDPNSAPAEQLSGISGVTPAIASAIVAGRPYKNMVAVDKVLASSLNEKQRDSVYSHLWVPIDLNTATDEEILLIPGVGSRMLREFKEYRPYKSIDTFRREISKYVDKDEEARLERFVTIK
jgi:DNA uptake protein ComE-like DNA-binding protein